MKPAKSIARNPADNWCRQVAGAALIAGAGIVATPQDANAQIVTWTPNISTTGTTGNSLFFFDFISGTASPTTFAGYQFVAGRFQTTGGNAKVALAFAAVANNQVIGNAVGGYFYSLKLAAGAPIAPASPFMAAGTNTLTLAWAPYPNPAWLPLPSSGYLGMRFGDGTNFN